MYKNQKGFLPIIIILVVLIGFVGVYYLGTLKSKNTAESITGTLPELTPPIIVDQEKSWQEYEIDGLNLSLKLPPELSSLGNWRVENLSGDTGNNICFSLQPKSSFFVKTVLAGGVGICSGKHFRVNSNSVDYSAGRGGVFGDISGYRELGGEYYTGIKIVENQPSIPAELVMETTNKNGLKYLRVIGTNSTEYDGPTYGTPGQGGIGALILTNNSQYPGITVSMDLSDKMTSLLFDEILSTFRFIN